MGALAWVLVVVLVGAVLALRWVVDAYVLRKLREGGPVDWRDRETWKEVAGRTAIGALAVAGWIGAILLAGAVAGDYSLPAGGIVMVAPFVYGAWALLVRDI